jgi:hypothetical protein
VIAVENRELLTKHEILERQIATLPKPNSEQGNHIEECLGHSCPASHREDRTTMLWMWTKYWQGTACKRSSIPFDPMSCSPYGRNSISMVCGERATAAQIS